MEARAPPGTGHAGRAPRAQRPLDRPVEGRARQGAVRPARVAAEGDVLLARHADALDAAQRVPARARHPRSDRIGAVSRRRRRWCRRRDGRAHTACSRSSIRCRPRRWSTTRTSWRGCGRCRPTSTRRSARSQEHVDAGLTQPAVVVDLVLEQLAAQRRPRAVRLAAAGGVPDGSRTRFPPRRSAGCAPRRRRPTRSSSCRRGRASRRSCATGIVRAPAPRPASRRGRTGAAAYARLIKHYTTTSGSPERDPSARPARGGTHRARDAGDRPRLRLHGDARRLRAGAGQSSRHEVREPGRDAGLRDGRAERAAADDVALFLRQPRARVGVRPIPPDREASHASNYIAGTADGSRQAWFNMNTYRPRDQVKYTDGSAGAARDRARPPSAGGAGARARGRADVPALASGVGVLARGGRCMPRGSARRSAWSTGIRPRGSAGSPASGSARCAWWSIPACMPWGGRASGPASTSPAHVPSQSLAEVDRYIAQAGAGARLQARTAEDPRAARPGAEGARRAVRSARRSTTSSCATARSRWTCWRKRSIRTFRRRGRR